MPMQVRQVPRILEKNLSGSLHRYIANFLEFRGAMTRSQPTHLVTKLKRIFLTFPVSQSFFTSPVVYKNHVCESYFPPTKNQAKISIPVHSVEFKKKSQ